MLRRPPFLPTTCGLALLSVLAACPSDPTVPAETDGSSSSSTGEPEATSTTGPGTETNADDTSTEATGTETTEATSTGTTDTGTTSTETTDTETTDTETTDTGATSTETTDTGTTDTTGTAPVCGDGIVDAGESCDDAGESVTCNADCTPAACGDGLLNLTAGETCDDGGVSAACDDDCTAAACGDALVNALAGEQCDGLALAGGSCQTAGFYGGALACDAACLYDTSACNFVLETPVLMLGLAPVKRFDFSWAPVVGADYYELLERITPADGYVQLGAAILGESISLEMPLHLRHQASYVLRACNVDGCVESAAVDVATTLAEAVGYVKASNPDAGDLFGQTVALSADGNTLAVGAISEQSSATGIDGDQTDDSVPLAGAVYVLVRSDLGEWSQQAYIKSSNTNGFEQFGRGLALSANGDTLAVGSYGVGTEGTIRVFVRDATGTWTHQERLSAPGSDTSDYFGMSLALSADGNTLAAGAMGEDGGATGIDGDYTDDSAFGAGAAYVFVRDGAGDWSRQAYVKASNTDANDAFGTSVALSGDGSVLVVGANGEDSSATGIDGDQANDSAASAGAVYVFERDGAGDWSQQAYVKASNAGSSHAFGAYVALSADGLTLAVGATGEESNATGIDGDQANASAPAAGAVYVLTRDGVGTWSQQAYVKASNTAAQDTFGSSVALSSDGAMLVVGAEGEDGSATGVGGDPSSNTAAASGAVYVYERSGVGVWSYRAYVKAIAPDPGDAFGAGYVATSLALSGDGTTLAVGAHHEDGSGSGLGGDPTDDTLANAGAVHLY